MTRNPLLWTASIAVLFVGGCLGAWLLSLQSTTAQLPRIAVETRGALLRAGATEAARTRVMLAELLDEGRKDLLGKAQAEIRHGADESAGLVRESLAVVQAVAAKADSRTGEALGIARELQAHANPVLENAATLTANYAALPERLGAELRPSWLAIQPEITCRQADGSGYGGCWHSRVTGLMGEALRVGGVFTQQFPALVKNFNGIEHNVEQITAGVDVMFFHPPPRTKKQKVFGAMKDLVFVGSRVYGGAK